MPTRLIIQQIKSAKLLIDEEKQEFAHTSHSGIVVYCAFLKDAESDDLSKIVEQVLAGAVFLPPLGGNLCVNITKVEY